MILTILGKRGCGKSTLTKELICSAGGKVLYLSPVETLNYYDYEIWDTSEMEVLKYMNTGQIALVRCAQVEALDIMCLIAMTGRDYTIVIDEIELYTDSIQFSDLIHYGRHFRSNIISNSRRYTDIPRLLTSQTDQLFLFKINEPSDLEYIRKYTSREYQEIIKSLPDYHYCIYPSLAIKSTQYPSIL